MENNSHSSLLKRTLFGGMLLILVFPMLQHKFKWIKVKPLAGAIEKVERPIFSMNSWFEGTYQDKKTDYLNQNVGFRNLMVRTYNQIDFTLYNKANANGVVIGVDKYLYEENYIRAYNGEDYRGEEVIKEQIRKLEMVTDTLAKLGKQLVVLLAPGKASFFPEFIPFERRVKKNRNKTNLYSYQKALKNSSIPHLDMNKYFTTQKDKMKYPLFPKTGIHWSKYGEIVMADTLISFMNTLSNVQLPKISVDSYTVSKDMWDTDDDIEKGMNLLFNIPDNEMGYPSFHVVKDSTKKYAKVLTIADSYFWGPFNWGMSRDVFSGGQFWYYNEAIYPDSYDQPISVKDINQKEMVESNDVILIICTDANLFKFGFGFIEETYSNYFENK